LAGKRGRDALRIVPAALLAAVLAVSCENPWVIKLTDSLVEEKDGRPVITITSVAGFAAWLASQPANTADTAYTVKLNVGNLADIKDALYGAPDRYVYLDLSGSTITGVELDAFIDCENLTGITLPNSVTGIGNNAFTNCASLKSVTFTPVSKVAAIGDYAFANTSLTSITIPAGVTGIGYMAFDGCAGLTRVTFAAGSNITNANFGGDAFPEGGNGAGGNALMNAYNAASPKAGTYTRPGGGAAWTKQP